MKYQDTEKFISGHNLIFGDVPENIALKAICEKVLFEKNKLETLGLFGGNNDYNKFFPELKAEDLKPKKEDYAYPVFRALSQTRVRPYFPVNFEKNGVLQESMPKLVGQTVYPNHEAEVGNQLGAVYSTEWQESQTVEGLVIPAGINSMLQLDAKSNPNIIRGVMGDPPSVHSTSVTVQFEWEQSHPNMSRDEFYSKVGTFDSKGVLIERMASKIIAYHEISFVSHGADPYAQKIGTDGKIINPTFADTQKFSADPKQRVFHFLSFKDISNESFSIEKLKAIPEPNKLEEKPINPDKPMNKELRLLLVSLGIDPETANSESFKAETLIADLKAKDTKLSVAEAKVIELTSKVTELTTEKDALAGIKAQGEEAMVELRNEATRLYQLSTPTPEQSMLDLISKADAKSTKTYIDNFQKQVEEKFEATCNSCGSKEVTRASSKKEGNEDPTKDKFKKKTDAEVLKDMTASASFADTKFIHGSTPKK